MLIQPTIQEAEKYIDFAYDLALDPARSGYPTYTDGIKTKEDFVESCYRGLNRENRRVLLYCENGSVMGWIQFTFLDADKYLQTEIFNISGSIQQALAEFTAYCEMHFCGYALYLGLPAENAAAIAWLDKQGWNCLEQSYNDVLFFDSYELQTEERGIVRVTRDNFEDFRMLHQPIEEEMYWTSQRLFEDLDNWVIYLLYREKKPIGAIYYTGEEGAAEVFGVDYAENYFDPAVFKGLVTKALNACKSNGIKHIVFFNDAESQETALECGFSCVGQYVLHTRQL